MPHLGEIIDSRHDSFQQLRPICIALSQAAHALLGSNTNIQDVADCLLRLRNALVGSSNKFQQSFLDAKLADYAFFPVSQVLKVSQKVTIQCLELCLECIIVLIQRGWRHEIAPPLAAQLLILCTLLAQDQPKGFTFPQSPTYLQASAYACLRAIGIVVSPEARNLLRAEANFPQLGQTISVTLHGVSDGRSHEVQVAAIEALHALLTGVLDRDLCAGFLPGIVSTLTRAVSPTTKQRRNPTVLLKSLETLTFLLKTTLKDIDSNPEASEVSSAHNGTVRSAVVTAEWRQSTGAHLKHILSPVMRLSMYERSDVKLGLKELCFVILGECRRSLQDCTSMALETSIALHSDESNLFHKFELRRFLQTDSSLIVLLQATLYQWLESLTTKLQSPDAQGKSLLLQRINVAYDLLAGSGADTHVIDGLLASKLRDGIIVTMQAQTEGHLTTSFVHPISSMNTAISDYRHQTRIDFDQPLVRSKGQREIMYNLDKLITSMTTNNKSMAFIASIARDLRTSHGDSQLANFWLLLTTTTTALQSHLSAEDYLHLDGVRHDPIFDHLEQLYGCSLSVLTDVGDKRNDPRLKALALRALSLRARIAREDFKWELVDSLYPVLHTLAIPDDQLQHDSMATLDTFTVSCGYDSVKHLIVENVDYLTNAVALKLNAFDVSPQAAQVLLMMVRLAGSNLLPYLEDILDSVFDVLESYHGYPLLVELLFKVLSVIAEEGAQTQQLMIANGSVDESRKILLENWRAMSIDELETQIDQRAKKKAKSTQAEFAMTEPQPERSSRKSSYPGEIIEDDDQSYAEAGEAAANPADPDIPPEPKIYALLFRIADLTQHFLPSASPTLRISLLGLIKTTIPPLARHENSFLPLINTLWPEIISRLDDDETFIQAMSLDIIGLLCEYAGSFMRSRITSIWPRIIELQHNTSKEIVNTTVIQKNDQDNTTQYVRLEKAVAKMQDSPAEYSDANLRILWNALIRVLASIAQNIGAEADTIDQMMEMLAPSLEKDNHVRLALERQNADALWLRRMRAGKVSKPIVPELFIKFRVYNEWLLSISAVEAFQYLGQEKQPALQVLDFRAHYRSFRSVIRNRENFLFDILQSFADFEVQHFQHLSHHFEELLPALLTASLSAWRNDSTAQQPAYPGSAKSKTMPLNYLSHERSWSSDLSRSKSTDFEVHRNWLALTHSLSIEKWYYESTSEWTLDYPPFFAYFEWALSQAAQFVDKAMLNVHNLGHNSWQTIYFQRATVFITEIFLILSLYLFIKSSTVGTRTQARTVALSILLSPGLLIIDHIHFQYNGFLYGVLVLSIVLARTETGLLRSGLLFGVLLCLKHIYAYLAPAYFIYLLRRYCLGPKSILNIRFQNCIKLGMGLFAIIAVAFGPFAYYGQIPQVLSRLFPFARGLCHAYWAPNIWALYSFVDRPALLKLFLVPTWTNFVSTVTLCGYASFLFGWHVHEKAILLIIVPFSLLALKDRRYLGAFRPLAVAGHVSLFPLLFTSMEFPIKTVYTVLWLMCFLLAFDRLAPASEQQRMFFLDRFSLLYIAVAVPLIAYCSLIHQLIFGFAYEFLPLMLISSYSAIGVVGSCLAYMHETGVFEEIVLIWCYGESDELKRESLMLPTALVTLVSVYTFRDPRQTPIPNCSAPVATPTLKHSFSFPFLPT
nr:dolichyl pyrophosphate glc1man9glcnac2 alpha-1,3-glucosyltransferase [Quercus suber]